MAWGIAGKAGRAPGSGLGKRLARKEITLKIRYQKKFHAIVKRERMILRISGFTSVTMSMPPMRMIPRVKMRRLIHRLLKGPESHPPPSLAWVTAVPAKEKTKKAMVVGIRPGKSKFHWDSKKKRMRRTATPNWNSVREVAKSRRR
jgi:hypothetical protein